MAGPAGPAGDAWGEEAATFAGFTAAVYTGNQGGRASMHAACAAEFPGTHLCHASEYYLSNSATPVPALGAWLDASCGIYGSSYHVSSSHGNLFYGRYVGSNAYSNCYNWTTDNTNNDGHAIGPGGVTSPSCDTALPLACCSTEYLESFAGFTMATTSGNMAGRANGHALCGTEFPSSHMCHAAELARAVTSIDPPGAGAWLDTSSGLQKGVNGTIVSGSCAAYDFGRYAGSNAYSNCYNWTTDNTNNDGAAITATGLSSPSCDTVLAVACCY